MRTDSDLLGTMEVPDSVYYGIHTLRALPIGNISFSKLNQYPEIIRVMAKIKKSCAKANTDIGAMDKEIGKAIEQACDEMQEGKFDDQLTVDMFNGGGAIAINMVVNEIIANRANELLTGRKGYEKVHPNTHVNMCQSTNDVVPSAMKLVSYEASLQLVSAVKKLEEALVEKAAEFKDKVKLGRTCLNDALPITFEQEFSGYASGIKRQRQRIETALEDWLCLTLGGTAIGTGVGTMPGYKEKVYEILREDVNPRIRIEDNLFDGLQNADSYLYLSGLIKCLAVVMSKICYDIKLMGSGPFAGFGELIIPTVQAGSSIMPGKVNPAIPEMIIQVAQQVCGNDTTITMAVEKGELDLNISDQILLKNLLDSISLLTNAIPILIDRCIKDLKVNETKTLKDAEGTTALVTTYSMLHGYKAALKLALESVEQHKTVKEVAVSSGRLSQEKANILFDPILLTDIDRLHQVIKDMQADRDI